MHYSKSLGGTVGKRASPEPWFQVALPDNALGPIQIALKEHNAPNFLFDFVGQQTGVVLGLRGPYRFKLGLIHIPPSMPVADCAGFTLGWFDLFCSEFGKVFTERAAACILNPLCQSA